MKHKVLIALVALVLVGATTWLFLPDDPATAQSGEGENATPGPSPVATSGAAGSSRPDESSTGESTSKGTRPGSAHNSASTLAQERAMHKRMVAGQRERFEAEITNLSAKLGLDAAQEEALRDFFEEKLAQMENLLAKGDSEAVNALANIIRVEGLDAALEEILTPTQLASLNNRRADNRDRNVSAQSTKDLVKLATRLGLSQNQSEDIHGVLYDQAGARYDQNRTLRPLLALMSDGEEVDSSRRPYVLPEPNSGGSGVGLDQSALEAANRARIDREIAPLTDFLTEDQLNVYRDYLVNKATDAIARETTREEISTTEDTGSGKIPAPIFIPNR